MYDKRTSAFKSPDMKKMIEVVIDSRTKIYIAQGMDPKKARSKYLSKFNCMKH